MKTSARLLFAPLLLAAVCMARAQVPPSTIPAPAGAGPGTNRTLPSSFLSRLTNNLNRTPRIGAPGAPGAGPLGGPGNVAVPINPNAPAGPGNLPNVAGAVPGVNGPGGAGASGVSNVVPRGITDTIKANVIRFQEADISQIFEFYAELTGKTLLRSPQVPATTKITVRNTTELTKQEGINALNTILGLNGIIMIPEGDKFVKVLPEAAMPQGATPFTTLGSSNMTEALIPVAEIVTLKNLAPEDAISILTPYSKLANSIVGLKGSPVLVLRDYSVNVKRMMEILEKVDVAMPVTIELVVIPIKYALAGEIAGVLSGLGASTSSGISGGASGGGLGGGGLGTGGGLNRGGIGGGTGLSGANGLNTGFGGSSPYNNNSQLGARPFGTTGTTGTGTGTGGPNGFGQSRTGFGQRLNGAVNRALGSAGGQNDSIIGQAKIIPDERSNSLLVFADRGDLATISNIISKLDVVLPQVLIEALIMEVNLGDGIAYGVSMSQNHQKAGDLDYAGVSANGPSFIDPRNITSLGSFSSNALSGGGLQYFGKLNQDFDIAVTASANDSRLNVLSRPRIQTSTAKPASIFIGETRPYITGSYFSDLSGGGSRSQYSQTQIGISLNVLPIINQDGLVVMDIQQHISQTGDNVVIDGNDVPVTIDRDANAYVAVRDRDTIILGGFISTTKNKSNSGIPLLKDIPGLGVLFRSTSDNIKRVELMVLIRPTVLPNPEVAALTAAEQLENSPGIMRAQRDEAEYQRKQMDDERKAREKLERRGK